MKDKTERREILNIGELRLGSLLLNSKGKITQIRSLHVTSIQCWGQYPRDSMYWGNINGEPAQSFHPCPISIELLRYLGWRLQGETQKGVITMYPPKTHGFDDDDNAFPIHFIMEDNAIENYPKGFTLIKSAGSEEWWDILDMHSLDNHYYEYYGHRMVYENFIKIYGARAKKSPFGQDHKKEDAPVKFLPSKRFPPQR